MTPSWNVGKFKGRHPEAPRAFTSGAEGSPAQPLSPLVGRRRRVPRFSHALCAKVGIFARIMHKLSFRPKPERTRRRRGGTCFPRSSRCSRREGRREKRRKHPPASREAAVCNSPARKCRVSREDRDQVPRGRHTVARTGQIVGQMCQRQCLSPMRKYALSARAEHFQGIAVKQSKRTINMRYICAVLFCLIASSFSLAQETRADLFGGYSFSTSIQTVLLHVRVRTVGRRLFPATSIDGSLWKET